MKKWNKPELLSLGVENTFDVDCTCGVTSSTNDWDTFDSKKHPCHKTGNGLHNNNGNHGAGVSQNGHVDTSEACLAHDYCCCYVKTPSGIGSSGNGQLAPYTS